MKRSWALVLAAAFLLGPARPVAAERIASKPAGPATERAANLARVSDVLARAGVARALATHGLSAEQAQERLDRLSDEDLQRLAANLDQIQAAGNVPDYIWVLLGIFLAVSILAIIF